MSKGVVLSVSASVLFAVMYYFTSLLTPLSGLEIFGWRMLLTMPCMTVFMIVSGEWRRVWELVHRLVAKPRLIGGVLVSSALLGLQLWLFMWAPIHGRGLEVSLGYFLLPLVMVLMGCVLYKEKLSTWQMAAVTLACVGVGHEFWRVGSLAWETAYVAMAYPIYFFLRRTFKTDHLGGFCWDLCLILPVALYLTLRSGNSFAVIAQFPQLIVVVLGLGLLSALGLGSYMLASRYLPFVIFGLLSYLEPVLLAFASLALGERIQAEEWLTYIPIWLAVGLLVMEGALYLRLQRRNKAELARNLDHYQQRLND